MRRIVEDLIRVDGVIGSLLVGKDGLVVASTLMDEEDAEILGAMSAALVFLGVLSPLELPVIDTANFAGYVLWTLWLVSFGVLLLVRRSPQPLAAHLPARAAVSVPAARVSA